MSFEFILSQTDGRPMYLQIIDQIKSRVTVGDWKRGYKLPSIRELAVATRVSVITVKRAYQELEREGVIVTQQGKGSFIAEIDDLSVQLKQQEMDKYLSQAISVARSLGLSINDIKEALNKLMQSKNTNPSEKNHD